MQTITETKEVGEILKQFPGADRDSLIPILQAVQEAEGFLSRSSVIQIGKYLKLPASKIYGVATFYNQFRFQAQGYYHIQVCRGTACHVKGSAKVLEMLTGELGVQPGQTTRDGLFSIEVVACIGACGLAPVISINGEFYAKLTPESVVDIIETLRKEAEENGIANE